MTIEIRCSACNALLATIEKDTWTDNDTANYEATMSCDNDPDAEMNIVTF